MRVLLFLFCSLAQVKAFTPNGMITVSRANTVAFRPAAVSTPLFQSRGANEDSSSDNNSETPYLTKPKVGFSGAAIAGFASSMLAFTSAAMAVEEMEIAELPPPYVPVIFSLALIAGVGVLTGSLGSVIDEEASLGMQSGARAKKEIERSRSSYFKKK